MIAMGIAGLALIGIAVISEKTAVRVDPLTLKILATGGLGGTCLYLLYQLGNVFLLF